MKTPEEIKTEVAKKHGLGSTLVTGHAAKYWEEYANALAAQESRKAEKDRDEFLIRFENWKIANRWRIVIDNEGFHFERTFSHREPDKRTMNQLLSEYKSRGITE